MYTSCGAIVVGLTILSTATRVTAVQLASFTPRVEIDNAQCRAAYTTNIDGCTPNDFSANARCSAACVQGLVKIGEVVKRVCKDVDVGETSIIGVFQNDIGLAALCPGTSITTSTSTTSTRAPPQTSAQERSSRATTTSTSTISTSTSTSTLRSISTSTSTSPSDDDEPATTSSRALVYDPSPTSSVNAPKSTVQPPAQSSSAAAAAPRPNAQLSNADSGGGSPFDVQAVSASSRSRTMDAVALLGTALLLLVCA